MFRENEKHLQFGLFDTLQPLPENVRRRLEAFSWETDEARVPLGVTCPGRQRVEVRAGRKTDCFLTNFDQTACENCPLADQCPTKPLKRCPARVLPVRARQVQVAQLRQRVAQTRGTGNNWRAAIESTVRSVTHPFGGQLSARGGAGRLCGGQGGHGLQIQQIPGR